MTPQSQTKLVSGQSQVGSLSGIDTYYNKKTNMSPPAGSRAISTKPNNKIRMKSARKLSPAQTMLSSSQESVFLVLDNGGNQQFTNFYKSMPYAPQVVTEISSTARFEGAKTILLAPYDLRQHVIRSLPPQAQNIAVVFYSQSQIVPDTVVRHPLVDLVTDSPQDIA